MINCNYKVKIKDIQNKYRFKIFCAGGVVDLSDYYTKTETDTLLNEKANTTDIPDVSSFITKDVDDLTNYYTMTDIDDLVGDISTALDTINGEVI